MPTTHIARSAVDALVERARREIDEGLLPSCQLALALDGELIEQFTLGDHLGDDSRYATFSAIKGVVYTATWQLLAEGSLRLDQRVAELVPAFGTNGKEAVTIEQLICHRGGFPLAPLGPADWADRGKRLEVFGRWKLTAEPGTYAYHVTSAHWVLAEMLEVIDGIDFREALRRRLFDPLGLKRLELGVPVERTGDINLAVAVGEPATAEEFEAAIGVKGVAPDQWSDDAAVASVQPEHLEVGSPGGGGVSTAGDLARFYQALLHNRGGLWDPYWLHEGTAVVRVSDWDMLFAAPANRTIGMVVAGDDGRAGARGFGRTNSPATFGYNGFGGQMAWADPATGLSFAYLTNGIDRHLLRQTRRGVGIASRAAVCAA